MIILEINYRKVNNNFLERNYGYLLASHNGVIFRPESDWRIKPSSAITWNLII